jgi:hypothetical protein
VMDGEDALRGEIAHDLHWGLFLMWSILFRANISVKWIV